MFEKKILINTFFLFMFISSVLLFGETLFFSVSPFDTEYGLSFRYNFRFWKFHVDFYTSSNIDFSKGFPKLSLKEENIIKYFSFEEYPYKVTYSNFNQLPFNTFINPAQKAWHLTWLGTGYYNDNLLYEDQHISLIGNYKALNITFSLFDLDLFVERLEDKFNIGVGKLIYVFTGEKTGLGINYFSKNILIYALVFLDATSELKAQFGFTLKKDDIEINIGNEYTNRDSIFGGLQWKVGDIYVIGRLQGQKIRLVVEFPIW
ncbi:MAG: hypothetical protein ABDH59_05145 [Fervidobacterium sp.]